ncbi:MAG: sugar diacid recognition domain-containing protein [Lachnospiraceae bacterium]|nr:sugar diacid recognition domain-containing protein [Lachnospiraceae bacterium]
MINKIFAQNFVRKIEQNMKIKVNVMDERGVIIASTSKERVGDFHICAYEIIQNSLPMLVTTEPTRDLIGVNAPGVNLRLTSSNETIGVIGVSGNPDEITEIAKMVKLTFETMYEYEYKKNASMKGHNSLWNFAHVLLAESPLNEVSIKKAASRMKLSDDYPRIPIYIRFYSEYLNTIIQHFLDSYASCSCYRHQDIVLPVDRGIFLLKSFSKDSHDLYGTEALNACLERLKIEFIDRESTSEQLLTYKFFIGPVQTKFIHYHSTYQNLLWLASRQKNSMEITAFLMDHLLELLLEHCSKEVMAPLFDYYDQVIQENLDTNQFLETSKGLVSSDMKLETAAQLLHLHKNSVIARLKKVKEVLEINPIANPKDAALLRCLCFYLQQEMWPGR